MCIRDSDTIGYGLNKDNGIYWWYPLLNMFNIQAEGWEYNEAEQEWRPEILSDRAKQAVMWIADMYDNGFINSNYNTTTTYEMAKSDFCSGKSGIITYNAITSVPEGTLEMMTQFIGKVAGSKSMGDVVRGMPVVTGADGVKRDVYKRQGRGKPPLRLLGHRALGDEHGGGGLFRTYRHRTCAPQSARTRR